MMFLAVKLDVVTALSVLILLFSISSFRSLVKGNWRKNTNREQILYEDKDGIASLESTKAFSNKLQYIAVFALISSGLGLSIANAVYAFVKQVADTASTDSKLGSDLLLILAWVSCFCPEPQGRILIQVL